MARRPKLDWNAITPEEKADTLRRMRSYTRRHVYELLWSRPYDQVHEELGIREDDLRHFCRWYEVPVPSARYWLEKEAGLEPKRPPLYRTKRNDVSISYTHRGLYVSIGIHEPGEVYRPGSEQERLERERRKERGIALRAKARLEKRKFEFIHELALKEARLTELQGFIRRSREAPPMVPSAQFDRLVQWAEERLPELRAELAGDAVVAEIADWRLFAEDDERL